MSIFNIEFAILSKKYTPTPFKRNLNSRNNTIHEAVKSRSNKREQGFVLIFKDYCLLNVVCLHKNPAQELSKYRVSQKTWEFSDEFEIVFSNNSLI